MAIVSLQTFKAWVNDFNTSDADLQVCLDTADLVVKDYLGYAPEQAARTDYLNGNGLSWIRVNARNVTALTSVTIDGVALATNLFRIDDNAIVVKDGSRLFTIGRQNVVIVYIAGWETLPTILQHAVMRIGNIIRIDKLANGQSSITTPDGGTRSYVPYLKFDQHLAPLTNYALKVDAA